MKFRGHLLALLGSLCLVLSSGGAVAAHADVSSNAASAEASSAVESTAKTQPITTPDSEKNTQDTTPNSGEDGRISAKSQNEPANSPEISYSTHVKNIGWTAPVSSGTTSGKIDPAYDIEALQLSLGGVSDADSGISYSVQSRTVGWQSEVSNGAAAGTTGKNLPIEAIRIHLTGKIASEYSVYYRVYVANLGWTKYSKDDQLAGTVGMATNVEAVQVTLAKKDTSAPADDSTAEFTSLSLPTLSYSVQSQNIGWGPSVSANSVAGTVGKVLQAESFKLTIGNLINGLSGGISYQAHVQNKGWLPEVHDGQIAGTVGQKLQLQAFKIHLTGNVAKYFSVYYRSHVSNIGWTAFTKDGQASGSVGANLAIEAIQIVIVPKQNVAPNVSSTVSYSFLNKPAITYQAHSATIGWGNVVNEGQIAGTVGRNLQMEAMRAAVSGLTAGETGGVNYRVYVKNRGWLPVTGNNAVGGTTGQNLHAEALSMILTGELAKYYDIWYQVQVQNDGWLGWAKSGSAVGTTGMNRQIEAFRVKILSKKASAPGNTKNAFIDKANSGGAGLLGLPDNLVNGKPINKTYSIDPGTAAVVGKIIVLHSTAVTDATAKNLAMFESRVWQDQEVFVHYAVDDLGAYEIGKPGYIAWGAGYVNRYAPVQIELCEFSNRNRAIAAYRNWIILASQMATIFDTSRTLDSSDMTNGFKTHYWATVNYGGTDHTDPYGYLKSKLGITKAQLAKDLALGHSSI